MKTILTILFTLTFTLSFSQSIIFNNLNTNGGKISNENINITYTIGQHTVGTISNETNTIAQGFQQNYTIEGCTDSEALNYNPNATIDDGSCNLCEFSDLQAGLSVDQNIATLEIIGGTPFSDGSYVVDWFDNQNNLINEGLSNLLLNNFTSTLSNICNGNYSVSISDSICINPLIVEFTISDIPCPIYGCTDSVACNFDLSATQDNSSCVYASPGYDCNGNCVAQDILWIGDQDSDGFTSFDFATGDLYITIESFPNVGSAMITINGEDFAMEYSDWGANAHWYFSDSTSSSNVYNWTVEVANLCATSQSYSDSFTTDCQNMINGNSQDLGCGCGEPEPQAGYDCQGNCLDDADLDGVCDEFEIEGCTDIQASNFNDLATNDDGSCQYLQIEGCTDSIALNYNEEATSNDGSCVYEILGCTDENACNFNPEANTDNGDCIYTQTSYEDVLACESYEWNGEIYNESGTYTLTFSPPEIGANIGGGIVFFIDSSSNLAYVATENYISAGEWGCSGIEVNGSQSTNVGSGYQNTLDIISSDCGSNQSAALTCANYDNGFDDWFLPSLDELYLIYENLYLSGIVSYNTGNSQNWYWSSTEGTDNNPNSASNINFVDGFIAENNNKDSNPGGIIAVRTFNINNCDSTAVLNLTITEPDTSTTYITACESYEWNGETYTESGIYEYSEQNDNNYSMSFDGDGDYLFLGNADEYNFGSGDFSLQAWIKPNSNDQNSRIIAKGETNSQGTYQLNILNDKLRISFHNDENFSSENVIESGIWQHIAITRKNDTVKGFVDGEEVLNFVNNSNLTSNQDLVFGYEPGYSSWFNGLLNDVSIWNVSLSQEEIQNYINCLPKGNEEGLVGYWKFEEGEGDTIYDLSGNENHGIINGASYSTDVPEQSCQLTSVNGCDSVAILNLFILDPIEIIQNDTSVCYGDNISLSVGNVYNNLPINLQSGLVAYYPFNNNSNDESGNEHHGLVNGATLESDRFGNTDKAYYFDGNSTINIENHSDLSVSSTNKLSIAVWAKSTSNQFVSHILGKRTSSIEYQIGWFDNFNIEYGIGYGFWEHIGIPFPQDEWTHLVMTYNNSEWKLYMNGDLIHSYYNETTPNDGDLIIGGSANYTKFIGIIDDLGVWNRELSETEIYELYSNTNQFNQNILWSTGETTNTINIEVNETLTYWVNNYCYTDSIEVTLNIPDTTYLEATACESYEWNGQAYTESGTYFNSHDISYLFDGVNDYIEILEDESLQNLSENSYTISMWIMPYSLNSLDCNDNYSSIVSLVRKDGEYNIMIVDGKLYAEHFTYDGFVHSTGSTIINLNEWYYLTVKWDGTNHYFYINGDEEVIYSDNINFNPVYSSLNIGRSAEYCQYFNGLIYDLKIWNSNLSNQTISDNYNCILNTDDNVYIYNLNQNSNIFNGIGHSIDIPNQSCQFTTTNDCDNVEVLNLTITQPNTTYTEVTACESYEWNGITYTESGTFQNVSNNQITDEFSITSAENQYGEMVIPYSNSFAPNSEFTFACYFMPNENNITSTLMHTGIDGDPENTFTLQLQYTDSLSFFRYYIRSEYGSGTDFNCTSESFELESNEWYFLSVTFDGSYWKFYLDSQYISNTSAPAIPGPWSDRDLHLINSQYSFDDVQIWNKCLTSSELIDVSLCFDDFDNNDLQAYWDFEINSNDTAYDKSNNNHHALLQNKIVSNESPEKCIDIHNNDCIDISILDLLIYDNYNTTDTFKICNGESITIGNNTYDKSGSYVDTLTSINGCDSIVNTIIEVFTNGIVQNNITICPGDSISLNSISSNSPSVTITLTSTLPSCVWFALNTSFEDYSNDLYGYEYYCSCANGPTYLGCPNIPTGTFITPSEDVNSLGNSIVESINQNSDYFYATFNAFTDELTIYSTVNDLSTIEIDGSSWFVNGNDSNCPGPCTSLFQSSQNSSNFLWSTGETSQNIIIDPIETTSYNLTQYDFDGFSCIDSVLIYVEQSGCNDPLASNYNSNVVCSDNSLCTYIIEGCTDENACNFNPEANADNGDCIYPQTSYEEAIACESYEWNGNTYTESGTYEYSGFENVNNYSISFDGDNDYISFNGLDGVYNSFSFVTKVKLNSDDFNQTLFYFGHESTDGNTTSSIDLTIDKFNFPSSAQLQINLNADNGIAGTQSFSLGTWIDIAGVFDGDNQILHLYVDDQIISSETSVNNLSLSINDIHKIGAGNIGSLQSLGNFFDGTFSYLSIFNKILSQEEIQNFKFCPPNGNEIGILSHWKFEDVEGDTVIDLSGNGNDGIIHGGTFSSDVPEQSCQLTTVNGCDSIAVLNLTINNSNTVIDTQIHCDTYTWIDGITYTESNNTATFTLTNSNNCDSIVILNLSIENENCGCVDPIAYNFDSTATLDNGSCIYCTFEADIISQSPTTQTFCDGYYAVTPYGQSPYSFYLNGQAVQQYDAAVCNGIYDLQIIDANNCQFDSTLVISNYLGCKDPEALNYDATALFDDGSCIDVVLGCMDELADNYNENANVDDDNCIYYGCTDISADNFDESANVDDESCIYCDVYITGLVNNANTSFNCNGLIILSIESSHEPVNITWDNGMNIGFLNGLCSGDYTYLATDAQGCELTGTITVDGTVVGCTDPTACNYQSVADIDDGSCAYLDDVNIVLNSNESGQTILTWDELENANLYSIYKGSDPSNMSLIGTSNEPFFIDESFNNQSYYYQVSSFVECLGITNDYFSEPVLFEFSSDFSVNLLINNASCLCCDDGSVSYTISGGFPPYQLSDLNTVDSLSAGQEFIIYISDNIGNPFFQNVTINYDQETSGCTDNLAINFSACATEDDGTCEYENISACEITPDDLFVDNIIHNRVRFNWSLPAASPSYYMIRYRAVGTNAWTVMRAGPETANPFNGTSRTRYFMEPGTTYQWNIRARNIDENGATICQSPWSVSHQFTTLDACPNLANHSVVTEANWVDFYADATISTIETYNSKGKLRELNDNNYRYITGTSSGINFRKGNFSASTNYEWHTKAWCIGNVDNDGNPDPQYHSGWGDFYPFTTQAPCDKMPTNLHTTTNNNQNLITMNWDTPQSGAPDHYFLELTNQTTGQVFQWNNISGEATSKTKYNQIPGHNFSWKIRGACGSIGTSWATIFSQEEYYTLGADRQSNFNALTIYPNPSRDIFNLSFIVDKKQDIIISIVNVLGETISIYELENFEGRYHQAFDLTENPKGIYLLRIYEENKVTTHKLTLQ